MFWCAAISRSIASTSTSTSATAANVGARHAVPSGTEIGLPGAGNSMLLAWPFTTACARSGCRHCRGAACCAPTHGESLPIPVSRLLSRVALNQANGQAYAIRNTTVAPDDGSTSYRARVTVVEKFQNFFYSLEEIVVPAVRHRCVFFPCAQTSLWRVFWMSRAARQTGPRKTHSGAAPAAVAAAADRLATRLPSTRRSARAR